MADPIIIKEWLGKADGREFGGNSGEGNSGDIIPIIVIDLPEIGIMSPDYAPITRKRQPGGF